MESLIYKIKQLIRRLLGKDKKEFEENKAAVLAAATEELARRGQAKEEKSIELWPYQKDMMVEVVKFFRQREEEEKKLRKWRHYAEHAKKWRIRKKYKKKIQEYYKNKSKQGSGLIRGGNWSYGSGAGMFYLEADRSHFYPRTQRRQGDGIGKGLAMHISERMTGVARGGKP